MMGFLGGLWLHVEGSLYDKIRISGQLIQAHVDPLKPLDVTTTPSFFAFSPVRHSKQPFYNTRAQDFQLIKNQLTIKNRNSRP